MRTRTQTILALAAILGVLVSGCGDADQGESGAGDAPTPARSATESAIETTTTAERSESPSPTTQAARGAGESLRGFCEQLPIAELVRSKVAGGKLEVTVYGPREAKFDSESIICNLGSPDFQNRIASGDSDAIGFAVVYEKHPGVTCADTFSAMEQSAYFTVHDDGTYESSQGAAGFCHDGAGLGVTRVASAPASAADVATLVEMRSQIQPRLDDFAERYQLERG